MAHPAQAYDAGYPAVALHPLTFVEEGDQVIIGRPDIDSFAVFPADAAAVVRQLRTGVDLVSVAAWYQETYGEPADIDDFIDTLRDLGFVRSDATDAGDPAHPAAGQDNAEATGLPASVPVRWRRLGIGVFSAPALALYAIAVVAACYLMATIPALTPAPSKVFFTGSLVIVLVTTATAELIGIFWHEAFHVLAGRRLGLPSTLSIGRRLNFVVFQTTLTGLMGVPSRKRILPFLAGLIADAILIAFLTALGEASRLAGWPPLTGQITVALVYVTILRMLWQAMIFLETDLYYVFASVVRCPDLHRMTRAYLRSLLVSLTGGTVPDDAEAGWTARDHRVVRWYAPFVVAGSLAVLALVAVSATPILAGFAIRIYHGVVTGSFASPGFWDSLVAGAAILSQFAVLAAVALRDRRRRLTTEGSA
jgi:hypothetical protein